MISIQIVQAGAPARRVRIDGQEARIGRESDNHLMLPDAKISKHHAIVRASDERIVIEDLKSTNGTYVNGSRLMAAREVNAADEIELGDYSLKVERASCAAKVAVQTTPASASNRRSSEPSSSPSDALRKRYADLQKL